MIYITCHLKVTPVDRVPDQLNKACSFSKSSNRWSPVEGPTDICRCCSKGRCGISGRSMRLSHREGRPVPRSRRHVTEEADVTVGPLIFLRKMNDLGVEGPTSSPPLVTPVDRVPDQLNKACSFSKSSNRWSPVEGPTDICRCCSKGRCGISGRSMRLSHREGRPVPRSRRHVTEEADVTVGPLIFLRKMNDRGVEGPTSSPPLVMLGLGLATVMTLTLAAIVLGLTGRRRAASHPHAAVRALDGPGPSASHPHCSSLRQALCPSRTELGRSCSLAVGGNSGVWATSHYSWSLRSSHKDLLSSFKGEAQAGLVLPQPSRDPVGTGWKEPREGQYLIPADQQGHRKTH
ncbi:hypothetical protein E5288_WYG005817 [Bos mutus]|uniref:Zona pellucida sperm-binding protein 3 n=1 Tax=Bos mutus TaxID=72004 RepID=A0A6B0QVV2_9CETA|nr:hypothetical protein [Bos mutus]